MVMPGRRGYGYGYPAYGYAYPASLRVVFCGAMRAACGDPSSGHVTPPVRSILRKNFFLLLHHTLLKASFYYSLARSVATEDPMNRAAETLSAQKQSAPGASFGQP